MRKLKNIKIKYENYIRTLEYAKKTPKIVISSDIVKQDYMENYDIPEEKLFIIPPGVDFCEKNLVLPNKDCFIFGLVGKSFTKKGAF